MISSSQRLSEYNRRSVSQFRTVSRTSNFTPLLTRKQTDTVTQLLRSKTFHYMKSHPTQILQTLQQKKSTLASKNLKKYSKLFSTLIDIPHFQKLETLIEREKQFLHIYREKMEFNFDQCFKVYLEIINAAIQFQYEISSVQIDRERSLLIQCCLFVARTLTQIGMDKLGVYFCVKGINLCQLYGKLQEVGELLFLMGSIARRLQRFEQSVKLLKKSLQYLWYSRNSQSKQLQIELYSILSYCLLQTNNLDQSKIFAYKYEIGYIERQSSKIIELSHQLINSVQKRKNKWHAISKESIQLLFEVDIQQLIAKHSGSFMRLDQKRIMQVMKINFQFLYENFLHDQIFFYEVPLPLEVVVDVKTERKKAKEQNHKFIVRKGNSSLTSLRNKTPVNLLKIQAEKPKQMLIFNYRGIGVSKQKLLKMFTSLVAYLKKKKQQREVQKQVEEERQQK